MAAAAEISTASIALPLPLPLLPLPLCHHCHLPAVASVPPLLRLCSTTLPLCCHYHSCSAANTALPPLSCRPAALLLAAAEMPPPLPSLSLLCCHCATAVLPPSLCLRCCHHPASLPSCCTSAISLSLPPPFCCLCHLEPPSPCCKLPCREMSSIVVVVNIACRCPVERICPSGGSISRIPSTFGVGVRSFSWNRSVRNGRVLGESSTYFCEASRRLSTGREWDWHAPDTC
jgi:hypothetical protein